MRIRVSGQYCRAAAVCGIIFQQGKKPETPAERNSVTAEEYTAKIRMYTQQKEVLENAVKQTAAKAHITGGEFRDGRLRGSICFKKICCGKPNCICAQGKETFGHGPYPHLQWWDGGKLKTRYLNRQKYPVYEKILHWQHNIETVEENIRKTEEEYRKENGKGKKRV